DYPGAPVIAHELALGFRARAELHVLVRRPAEAAEDYRSARDLFLRLTETLPGNRTFALELSRCLCELGDLALLGAARPAAGPSSAPGTAPCEPGAVPAPPGHVGLHDAPAGTGGRGPGRWRTRDTVRPGRGPLGTGGGRRRRTCASGIRHPRGAGPSIRRPPQ